MKKLLALLMAIFMILSMTACASLGFGDGDDISWEDEDDRDDDKDNDDNDEDDDEDDDKEQGGENNTPGGDNSGNNNNQGGNVNEGEKPSGGNTQVSAAYTVYESLKGTVIMDNAYVTVTMKEMNIDRWGNTAIDVQVKNNTDESVTFDLDQIALNGRMSSGYCNCTVDAGETVDTAIELYENDIKRISMKLCVFDADYDTVEKELVDVYPEGRDAYVHNDPDISNAVESLVESNYSLSFTGYDESSDNYSVLYTAVNDTDMIMDCEIYLNAINGLYIGNQDYRNLLPNTYLTGELWINNEDLNLFGINNITMLDIKYEIYEVTDDGDYSKLNEKSCVLYPNGENHAEQFVYSPDQNDVLVYEQDGIRLIFAETITDSDNDMQLLFYFENGTGSELSCDCQIIEINGVNTEDTYFDFWVSTPANMSTFAMEYLWESDLEEYGIKEISSMKLKLSISKRGNFVTNIFDGTVEFSIP